MFSKQSSFEDLVFYIDQKADSENICETKRKPATNEDRMINTEKEVVTRMMVGGKQDDAQTTPQPELYTLSHKNPNDPERKALKMAQLFAERVRLGTGTHTLSLEEDIPPKTTHTTMDL